MGGKNPPSRLAHYLVLSPQIESCQKQDLHDQPARSRFEYQEVVMKFGRTHKMFKVAALGIAAMLSVGGTAAFADTFLPTYLGPGVQTPTGITPFYETFDTASYNGTSFVTNFGGSPITGTYTGSVLFRGANLFGGAGGTGQYITPPNGGTYTLTLSSSVNYFGMWFSALDNGNQLRFYMDNALVYSFSPSNYSALVGACPTASPEPNFCGNPNANFFNQDSGQQYAFLNFYDSNGAFNKVVFTEDPAIGEFESDNHSVANISTAPGGTPLTGATPEPSTWVLALTGLGGLLLIPAMRQNS